MRRSSCFALLLLGLAACSSGSLKPGGSDDTAGPGDGGTTSDGGGTTGDGGGTTGDGGGTSDGGTSTSPWAGAYTGTFALQVDTPGGPMDACAGDAAVTVDDSGAVTGNGSCISIGGGGPGGGGGGGTGGGSGSGSGSTGGATPGPPPPPNLDLAVDGIVADDGTFTGNVSLTATDGSLDQTWPGDGTIDASGVALGWSGTLPSPSGDMPYIGNVSAH